ncbi:MAG: nucleotide-binding protein [Halobacteriota archaeon]
MIISVASGKGGTGKTTVATNLALTMERDCDVYFFDCDVEAPNAHLFLKPHFTHSEPVIAACPTVDSTQCTFCGACTDICAFKALAIVKDRVLVFPDLCHDCGGCKLFCPEHAIGRKEHRIGRLECGHSDGIAFWQGTLCPGEAFSSPIIRALKQRVPDRGLVIVDAPPGTSCPVVEAIEGSDICLLVTEPTPFGLHDLTLAVRLVRKLDLKTGVIINRADIGDSEVEKYCRKEGLPVVTRIPYDKRLAIAYAQGMPVVGSLPYFAEQFRELYQDIRNLVDE